MAGTYQFGNFINFGVKKALSFGYKSKVYDLGGLGYGQEWAFNPQFVKHGFYVQIGNWRSRALHKPLVVRDCLGTQPDFVTYIDADALLIDSIDEVVTGDYDVGVTVRRPGETCSDVDYMDFFGCINAGVIFFNNTPATHHFCDKWQAACEAWQNDQRALNHLINPENRQLLAGETFAVNDVRVRCFPADIYNFYYFPEEPTDNTKILHYKDGLWKKLIS